MSPDSLCYTVPRATCTIRTVFTLASYIHDKADLGIRRLEGSVLVFVSHMLAIGRVVDYFDISNPWVVYSQKARVPDPLCVVMMGSARTLEGVVEVMCSRNLGNI